MFQTAIISWDMSSASNVPNFNYKLRYVKFESLSILQLEVELGQLLVVFQTTNKSWDVSTASHVPNFTYMLSYINCESRSKLQI